MAKELLVSVTKKDLRIEFFCAGGPGGQHQNKTASACRITHPDSGAVGESRESRHQHENKKLAFQRMVKSATFQNWLKIKSSEALTQETIEQKVERLMAPENIRTEAKVDGRWTTVALDELT